MEKIHVFLDESGAYGFDFTKANCSSHFIIVAALVNESQLNAVTDSMENIRKKYFQKGEIKSKNIRDKQYKRRIRILRDILALPINFALLVVDKKRIYEDSYLQYFGYF